MAKVTELNSRLQELHIVQDVFLVDRGGRRPVVIKFASLGKEIQQIAVVARQIVEGPWAQMTRHTAIV